MAAVSVAHHRRSAHIRQSTVFDSVRKLSQVKLLRSHDHSERFVSDSDGEGALFREGVTFQSNRQLPREHLRHSPVLWELRDLHNCLAGLREIDAPATPKSQRWTPIKTSVSTLSQTGKRCTYLNNKGKNVQV